MSRRAVEAAADRFVPGFLAPHGEKLQYLVVGVFNTVFGYAVWAALYALLAPRVGYALVLVMSYAVAIANAYVWYRLIVFRSHDSVWRELPRFSAVYLATMVVNLIVFPIAVRRLPINCLCGAGGIYVGRGDRQLHRPQEDQLPRAGRPSRPANRMTAKGRR